ncbi:glycosyltransferase [Flavimobilis sp. GY10621]|uniref:Glycosyltransferase n=1 Tax=Flavimobilis rhizosphaerae TaxID=2775421 RepID=A0ABR9DM88_9MICO|nr:glycosyltransferase [Flavimobilis rhizosphaerae]MBD9698238.1 glycosyltransferase [Flavimobilis rhizosphaerae]
MPHLLVAHPSADVYGSDLQLLETVEAVREVGWAVTVTLPGPGPLVSRLEDVGAAVVVDPGTPVLRKSALTPHGLVRLGAIALRAAVTGRATLRRMRPEVVLVNTVTIPTWLVAARLARVPAVCHVHEAEDGVPWLLQRALVAPLRLASTLLVNSRASADVLTAVDTRLGDRITVVHNGVPDAGPPAPLRARRAGDPARLALVARISPRKGVDVALEAVALLRAEGRDVTLDVCGTPFRGYEPFEAELRARAAQPDLAGAVRLLGYKSPTRPTLDDADIVLVPSRQEPFGNTAVEALLAGRPLVASATQGLTEIVTPGRTGLLVPPGEARALAQAVATLLDDPEHAARIATAGRAEAVRRFGVERYRTTVRESLATLASGLNPADGSAALTGRAADPAVRAEVLLPDLPAADRQSGPGDLDAVPRSANVTDPHAAPHVRRGAHATLTVVILTYRRDAELRRSLTAATAHVRALPDFLPRTEVLVVDNDPAGGAGATVAELAAASRRAGGPHVRYVHEPRPGIGAARARALAEVTTDLLVFLDDDDEPGETWLEPLVATWARTGATLVSGAIIARWEVGPDPWTEAGAFFRRPMLPTGTPRRSAPTGNLLVDVAGVRSLGLTFRADRGLRGGEDTLFTREVTSSGGSLVACAESVVIDRVPVERSERRWLLARVRSHAATSVDVEVQLATGAVARTRVRAASAGRGAMVTVRGALRLVAARGRDTKDVRARRDLARGAGLVAGAWGVHHEAYRRDENPLSTTAPATDGTVAGAASFDTRRRPRARVSRS